MYGVQNPCPMYGFVKQLPWIELNKQAESLLLLWNAMGSPWTVKPLLPSNRWSPASALAGFQVRRVNFSGTDRQDTQSQAQHRAPAKWSPERTAHLWLLLPFPSRLSPETARGRPTGSCIPTEPSGQRQLGGLLVLQESP